MNRTTTFDQATVRIRQRVGEIQSRWSPDRRERRAREGQRRRQEFLAQFAARLDDPPQETIWAVGSVCGDDLRRLAS